MRPTFFLKHNRFSITAILVFIVLLGHSSPIQSGYFHKIYVWNVGQGQWVTAVLQTTCFHFDMGGEKAPLNVIKALCENKNNRLMLSHTDLDHIQFIRWGHRHLPDLCLMRKARENLNAKKKQMLGSLKPCQKLNFDSAQEIDFEINSQKINDLSRIYELKSPLNGTLIPGDSTQFAEKIWSHLVASSPRLLVTGHHGSRTSTSDALLNHLTRLKMAISSSRKKRYGHPHKTVVERLQKHGVSSLRTEIWGTLVFDI